LGSWRQYTYDHAFGPEAQQQDVFVGCVSSLVGSVLEGYNATVLAYGPTGSGKTHTMGMGSALHSMTEHHGIIPRVIKYVLTVGRACQLLGTPCPCAVQYCCCLIPLPAVRSNDHLSCMAAAKRGHLMSCWRHCRLSLLSCRQLFDAIAAAPSSTSYVVKAQFLEIYNEELRDLLGGMHKGAGALSTLPAAGSSSPPHQRSIAIRECPDGQIVVTGKYRQELAELACSLPQV
jgi:hypothetical protein